MKRTISLILAVLSCAFSLRAQDPAFEWMLRTADPESSVMPGLSLLSSSDVSLAAFNNPAVIPYTHDRFSLKAGYSLEGRPLAGGGANAGAAAKVGRRVGIALAGNYNPGGTYEVIDDYGNMDGTFRTSSMLFSAGVGVKVLECLGLGVNLKYAGEKLAPDSRPGAFASDVYALFRWKGLGVTAGVSNVGTSVKDLGGTSFSLPSAARLAAGYSFCFAEKHLVQAGVGADCFFTGGVSASAGASYLLNDMLYVRAGYRFSSGTALPSCGSLGVGVKFFGVCLGAAYLMSSGTDVLTFTLGYGF